MQRNFHYIGLDSRDIHRNEIMVVIFGYTVNFTVCRVERDRDKGILIGGRRDKFYGSRIGSRSLQEAFSPEAIRP